MLSRIKELIKPKKKPNPNEKDLYQELNPARDLQEESYKLIPMDDDTLQWAVRKLQEIDHELKQGSFWKQNLPMIIGAGTLIICIIMLWVIGGSMENTSVHFQSAASSLADSCAKVASAAVQSQRI